MTDLAGLRILTDPRMPPGVAALVSPGYKPWFITGLAPERKPPMPATTLPPIMLPFDADLGPVREHARALAQGLAAFADFLEPEPEPEPQIDTETAAAKAEPLCGDRGSVAPPPPAGDGIVKHLVFTRPHRDAAPFVETVRARHWGRSEDGWIDFYAHGEVVASYRADTVEWVKACRP